MRRDPLQELSEGNIRGKADELNYICQTIMKLIFKACI